MKAEIDGGAVEGRVALARPSADGGSRFDAELKADRLDLDAAAAFVRSLAGPQADWPDAAAVSLDIGHASSAGQELHPVLARLGYGPKMISLDQLKIGDAGSVMVEGAGDFDRADATGKLALNSNAPSLGQITGLIAPLAPALAARLDAMGTGPGPAHLKLALDLGKDSDRCRSRERARRARPRRAAAQGRGHRHREARRRQRCARSISTRSGAAKSASNRNCRRSRAVRCWPCWGSITLSRPAHGPAQFEGSASGIWHAPLRLKVKITGAGLDADAQGTAEPWAPEPTAKRQSDDTAASISRRCSISSPSDALAQNISLSSRVVARRRQADLRRSGRLDCGLAAARAHRADAGRGKERRGRSRSRHA